MGKIIRASVKAVVIGLEKRDQYGEILRRQIHQVTGAHRKWEKGDRGSQGRGFLAGKTE